MTLETVNAIAQIKRSTGEDPKVIMYWGFHALGSRLIAGKRVEREFGPQYNFDATSCTFSKSPFYAETKDHGSSGGIRIGSWIRKL